MIKKYGPRMTFFVFGLAIGIGFVWLSGLSAVNKWVCSSDVDRVSLENEKITVNERKTGLEIRFKEFVETKDGLAADFEITNHDNEFYTYSAYQPGVGQSFVYFLPRLKLDGKIIEEFRCGMGLKDYLLKSGETKIFRYDTGHLSFFWKKEKNFQISFYFKKENQEYKEYWSEKLPINESLQEQLLKLQKQNRAD